jgi:hypothetical protein
MPWVLLWLGMGSAAFVGQGRAVLARGTGDPKWRWHWIDFAWVGLLLWYGIGVAVGASRGSLEVRPALALWWQQAALTSIYATGRLGAQDAAFRRLLPSAMVAFSLTLAFFAWYQYAIFLPDLHHQYQSSPETQKVAWLAAAGVSDTEPGSRMRELFESRLFNREPFATFTLANTLAIVLTPGVLLSLMAVFRCGVERRWQAAGWWLLAWIVLSGGLATTSSRTAILSVVAVSGAWLVVQWIVGRRDDLASQARSKAAGQRSPGWLIRGLGLGGLLLLVLLPVLTVFALWRIGRSDSQLLTGAPLSIQYRIQYWLASCEMIAQRPWLGWGPGNFQAAYAQFQPVEASETVADPHNFFFELAATAGLPAGLLFLVAIGAPWGWGLLAGHRGWAGNRAVDPVQVEAKVRPRPEEPGRRAVRFAIAGMVSALGIGLAIAWLGESVPQPLTILLSCGLLAAAWWSLVAAPPSTPVDWRPRWGSADDSLDWAPWVLGGLLLNLVAAGGVTYPAIAQTLALLAGLIVGAGQGERESSRPSDGVKVGVGLAGRVWPWWLAAALTAAAAIYAYGWQTLPVIRSSWAVQRAMLYANCDNAAASRREWRTALTLDRHNAEASIELAIHELIDRFRDLEQPEVWTQVQGQLQSAAARRPQSSPTRLRIAEALLQAAGQPGVASPLRVRLLSAARQWLNEGLELKPVDSRVQAQLSWLNFVLSDPETAHTLAREAVRLNERNPHLDLQLSRQWFSATAAEVPGLAKSAVRPVENSPGVVQVNAADWIEWLLRSEVTAK